MPYSTLFKVKRRSDFLLHLVTVHHLITSQDIDRYAQFQYILILDTCIWFDRHFCKNFFFFNTYSLLTPQNPRLDLFFVMDKELRRIQMETHLPKRKRTAQTALAVQRTALTTQWWTPTTQPARRMRAATPRMKAHSLKLRPSYSSTTLRNVRCRLCFENWCFTSRIPNLLYLLVRTLSLPPSAVFVHEVEILLSELVVIMLPCFISRHSYKFAHRYFAFSQFL